MSGKRRFGNKMDTAPRLNVWFLGLDFPDLQVLNRGKFCHLSFWHDFIRVMNRRKNLTKIYVNFKIISIRFLFLTPLTWICACFTTCLSVMWLHYAYERNTLITTNNFSPCCTVYVPKVQNVVSVMCSAVPALFFLSFFLQLKGCECEVIIFVVNNKFPPSATMNKVSTDKNAIGRNYFLNWLFVSENRWTVFLSFLQLKAQLALQE